MSENVPISEVYFDCLWKRIIELQLVIYYLSSHISQQCNLLAQ